MKISPNIKTIAVWSVGTFAALWIAENFLGIDISHHAAKKYSGGKGAKGGGAATTAGAPATPTGPVPWTCQTCVATTGTKWNCDTCTQAATGAAGFWF